MNTHSGDHATSTAMPSPSAERIRVGTDEIVLRVPSAATDGALLAAEVLIPAGGGPPALHRHDPEEVYRLERGELAIYLEDDAGEIQRHRVGPGDILHMPSGRAHTVRNEAEEEALAYVVFTPGDGFERFLRAAAALGAAGPPALEDVLRLAASHGVEITGPVPAIA
jgi:mannose-6-phosphate isomerase-like protein (cupin superfamily)